MSFGYMILRFSTVRSKVSRLTCGKHDTSRDELVYGAYPYLFSSMPCLSSHALSSVHKGLVMNTRVWMSYCFSAAALPGGWKARTTIIIIKRRDVDIVAAPVFFLDMCFGQAAGRIIRVYVSLNE